MWLGQLTDLALSQLFTVDVKHKSNKNQQTARGDDLCAVEDVLKPPGSLLATDRSKAVVLV